MWRGWRDLVVRTLRRDRAAVNPNVVVDAVRPDFAPVGTDFVAHALRCNDAAACDSEILPIVRDERRLVARRDRREASAGTAGGQGYAGISAGRWGAQARWRAESRPR